MSRTPSSTVGATFEKRLEKSLNMPGTVSKFLSMIRFSHTIFALPFALLAAAMAWKMQKGIEWQELVGILFCMVFARSAAMAFNRLADRKIDAGNPRTAGRHLPSGQLSVLQVTLFALFCSFAFVGSTCWFFPNKLPLYLSAPVLFFLFGYSFTKRFTTLAHFWLGAALALSPIAAWIAIRGEAFFTHQEEWLSGLMLGLAILTWVAGFDIIYACQDADFDRQAKLHSIPARLGILKSLRLATGCHAMTIVALFALCQSYSEFSILFWIAVGAVTILLIYQHLLVRPDDLSRVNIAFFNVNAVISLGLFAVGTLDLWLFSTR